MGGVMADAMAMAATTPGLPDPSERERAAIADSRARDAARRKRVRLKIDVPPEGSIGVGPSHSDGTGHGVQFQDAFGSASPEFASESLRGLMAVCREDGKVDPKSVNAALALVDGIRPEGELEAVLATQIAASHALSMRMMRKVAASSSPAHIECYLNAATKMQRTMTAQIEALTKLRRGGEQNVTVKHVHVHEGGQAIVGNVTAGGGRGRIRKRGQAHAQIDGGALRLEEMRSENAVGDILPIASCGR